MNSTQERKWLSEGPSLTDLIANIKDERKPGNKMALIIPTFENNDLLIRQLDKLKSQSFKGFDIIIVYGADDPFIKKPEWSSILHLRQKSRQGSSGGYYAGQRCAMDQGYETVVLSDNDCLPVSDDLMRELARAIDDGAQAVIANQTHGDPAFINQVGIPHYYGCFRRDVLIKTGLTYLPLFYGGEDIDLLERIRKQGIPIERVHARAFHPRIKPAAIIDPKKRFYCTRGEIESLLLRKEHLNSFLLIYIYSMMGLCYYALGRKDTGAAFIKGVWKGTGLKFFLDPGSKDDSWGNAVKSQTPHGTFDFVINKDERLDLLKGDHGPEFWLHLTDTSTFSYSLKRIANTAFRFISARKVLGKKIQFYEDCKAVDLPLMLMANEAWLQFDGKSYQLFRGRGILQIIFWIGAIAIISPITMVSSFALFLRGLVTTSLLGIKSDGYGTEVYQSKPQGMR